MVQKYHFCTLLKYPMNKESNIDNTDLSKVETIAVETENVDLSIEKMHKSVMREIEEEQVFDASELDGKSLEEIMEVASTILVLTPTAAFKKLKVIKTYFYEKLNLDKEEERSAFNLANTDTEISFTYSKEKLVQDMVSLDEQIKLARAEEKKRIQEERQKNLKIKQDLLVRLEQLVDKDETLESINEVKDIQREWKTIRVLPKDVVNELWDSYNLLLNRFYDNHGINIELKELDRQKNLSAKIELTKKVEEVLNEASLKRSFILLNKYHEEFKNIGPVPTESREPIWQAFKTASDMVYEAKRQVFTDMETVKEGNLAKKQILAEKANLLNAVDPRSPQDWSEKTKSFEKLFEEWKKIGPVPKSNNDAVWIQFNGVRNDFYTKRKLHFKTQNDAKGDNLKLTQALCEKAELLKDSTDWSNATKQILALQDDWKKIGPVPEKVNQAIWQRFRAACDVYFNAKNQAFAGRKDEENSNLLQKQALLISLEALATQDITHKEAFAQLKEINAAWKAIGFVPHKSIKAISNAYEAANNAVYTKFSSQIEAAKSANLSEHFKQLGSGHQGTKGLDNEEQNIKRKISLLNEEITGIENNMSFFAKSKTAEKMLKEFELKISKARKQIDGLKLELSALRTTKKEMTSAQAASNEDTLAPAES